MKRPIVPSPRMPERSTSPTPAMMAAPTSDVMPQHHVTLPASAFSDAWKAKLGGGASMGLRLVGQAKIETARGTARDRAWEIHPNHVDAVERERVYEERLMAYVVAFGACDPNDKAAAYFTLDNIGDALTGDGIRRLYDEYEAFAIAVSPLRAPTDDDAVHALSLRLSDVAKLEPRAQLRARKLLAFIASEIDALEATDMNAIEFSDYAADEAVRIAPRRG